MCSQLERMMTKGPQMSIEIQRTTIPVTTGTWGTVTIGRAATGATVGTVTIGRTGRIVGTVTMGLVAAMGP